jgi:hypothetical protein
LDFLMACSSIQFDGNTAKHFGSSRCFRMAVRPPGSSSWVGPQPPGGQRPSLPIAIAMPLAQNSNAVPFFRTRAMGDDPGSEVTYTFNVFPWTQVEYTLACDPATMMDDVGERLRQKYPALPPGPYTFFAFGKFSRVRDTIGSYGSTKFIIRLVRTGGKEPAASDSPGPPKPPSTELQPPGRPVPPEPDRPNPPPQADLPVRPPQSDLPNRPTLRPPIDDPPDDQQPPAARSPRPPSPPEPPRGAAPAAAPGTSTLGRDPTFGSGDDLTPDAGLPR